MRRRESLEKKAWFAMEETTEERERERERE